MLRVISCIEGEHDLSLLLLAICLCVLGCFTSISLFDRARLYPVASRQWLFLGGVVGGCGIWCMHFVAMLAFQPELPSSYTPLPIFLSLLISIFATIAGLSVAMRGTSLPYPEAGGLIIGLGAALMHFTGMLSLNVGARIEWNHDLILASLVLGIGFAILAMNRAVRGKGVGATYTAVVLLALSIISLHLTAMAAIIFVPDPTVAVPIRFLPTARWPLGCRWSGCSYCAPASRRVRSIRKCVKKPTIKWIPSRIAMH